MTGHAPMPPEGGDIRIIYRASEVIELGNRRYDEGFAAGKADALDVAALTSAIDAAIVDDESGMESLSADGIVSAYRAIVAGKQGS